MAMLVVPTLVPSPTLPFSSSAFNTPNSHGFLLYTCSGRIRRTSKNVGPTMAIAQNDQPTKLVTFLGKGGSGKTTSAIFAAQHYAMEGLSTCLVIHSQDPTAEYLFNCKIGTSPVKCSDNLSAVRLETTKMIREPLNSVKEADARLNFSQGALSVVVGEELGVLPGMDSIFSILALGRFLGFLKNASRSEQKIYDVIILDGMSSEEVVRMIGASSKARLYLKYVRKLAEKTDIGRLAGPSLLRLFDEAMGLSSSGGSLNGQTSSKVWDQIEQILERSCSFFQDPQSFSCYLVMDSNSHISQASALRYWGCAIQAGAQVSGSLAFASQNGHFESEDLAKNFSPLPFASIPHLSFHTYPDWSSILMDGQSQDARRILKTTSIMPPVNFDPRNKSITLLMPGFDKSEIKLYQFRGGSELLVEAGDQRRVIPLPPQIQGKVGGAKFIARSLVITMR